MTEGAAVDGESMAALDRLCQRLDDYRRLALREGRLAELDAVLAQLRANDDPSEWIGRADELLRQCGIARGLGPARTRGVEPAVPAPALLPGLGGGHPLAEAYVCPADRCARALPARDTAGEPACRLLDQPLRLLRL